MRVSSILVPLTVGCVASAPFVARADSASDADLRSFRASTDANATLATESTTAPGAWNLQGGHWFVAESASLRHREANGEVRRVIGPRVIGEPTVALGLGRRAAIGAVLPYVLYQDAQPSSLTAGRPPPATGIGDLALTGKAIARESDPSAGGLGVAVVTRVQLPTGDRSSFISDRGVIAELRGVVSMDYLRILQLTAMAGYRMRFRHHPVSDLTLGDTIPWGATLSLRPLALGLDPRRWLLSLEAHGELGAVPNRLLRTSRVSPAFLGLSVRHQLTKDLALFGGVELGLTDAIGGPVFRGVFGITFAPTIVDEDHDGVPDDIDDCIGLPEDGRGERPRDGCPDYEGEETSDIGVVEYPPLPDDATSGPPPVASSDADADGIPDELDKCPDQPETFNDYEDEDGCPELDRDNDTFLDAVDHCPDQPENFDGFKDDDGCPEAPPKGQGAPLLTETVTETPAGTRVDLQLTRPIQFDGTAPAKQSAGDLRAVAAWLLAHPGSRVQVAVKPELTTGGKAAGAGAGPAAEEAQRLAMTRAISVVEALVRYAHTGGVAEAVAWDPKAKAKHNVTLTVVPIPPKAPPGAAQTPAGP